MKICWRWSFFICHTFNTIIFLSFTSSLVLALCSFFWLSKLRKGMLACLWREMVQSTTQWNCFENFVRTSWITWAIKFQWMPCMRSAVLALPDVVFVVIICKWWDLLSSWKKQRWQPITKNELIDSLRWVEDTPFLVNFRVAKIIIIITVICNYYLR